MKTNVIPILMYHSIESEPRGSVMRGLSVPKFLFQIQLFTLNLLGYKGMSLSKLYPYLIGKKRGKVFGITFDDGYLNNFENALPILRKYNFSATCYVVAGNIGGKNFWDISKGVTEKKMMDEFHIREWIKQGMEIGSHSFSHIHLSKISSDILEKEISNSRKFLEDKFKTEVKHFCYPYGDFSEDAINVVKESGYLTATTVIRGRASVKSNLFKLPRVLVNHRTLPLSILLKVLTRYEDRR